MMMRRHLSSTGTGFHKEISLRELKASVKADELVGPYAAQNILYVGCLDLFS